MNGKGAKLGVRKSPPPSLPPGLGEEFKVLSYDPIYGYATPLPGDFEMTLPLMQLGFFSHLIQQTNFQAVSAFSLKACASSSFIASQ